MDDFGSARRDQDGPTRTPTNRSSRIATIVAVVVAAVVVVAGGGGVFLVYVFGVGSFIFFFPFFGQDADDTGVARLNCNGKASIV